MLGNYSTDVPLGYFVLKPFDTAETCTSLDAVMQNSTWSIGRAHFVDTHTVGEVRIARGDPDNRSDGLCL